MACNRASKKAANITLWVSLLVLSISIVVTVLFPTIYSSILKKETSLEEGSLISGMWKDIPLPIYEKLYFFNITNSEFFLNGSQPLNVTEVGPYSYKSKWVKKHPHWHSNNTVTYKEWRTYHFVPEMSDGIEEDVIYTLNAPMIIASSIAKNYPKILRAALSVMFGVFGEKVIIKRSIKELAYGGYDDVIIKYAPLIKPDIPYKEGKFSWLYGMNATNDGKFTVFTGRDDATRKNIINNWNGQERLNFWKGDTCNMLNGTNIEIGPPIDADAESYSFFQSFFCRSLSLNYTEDATHYEILSKRFKPTYSLFANKTENPDNYCFDVNAEHPSGVLDIGPCKFGAPMFISFPHFYLADPSYLHSVNGLNPNGDEHGSHLDVEPITGLSVHTSMKFQINIEISKIEGILQLRNVAKGIFPVFWIDLNLELTDHFANYLKNSLRNPKIIAYSVLGVLTFISILLVIRSIIVLCIRQKEEDDDCLIDAKDDIARIYSEERADENYSHCADDEKLLSSDSYANGENSSKSRFSTTSKQTIGYN